MGRTLLGPATDVIAPELSSGRLAGVTATVDCGLVPVCKNPRDISIVATGSCRSPRDVFAHRVPLSVADSTSSRGGDHSASLVGGFWHAAA